MNRTFNPLPSSVPDRFWDKVEVTGFCWNWTGAQKKSGYGNFCIDRVYYGPHRLAYRALVGEFDESLVIDHLCRNPRCVNPDHLEPVTIRTNNVRGFGFVGAQSRVTRCPQGHEYTPDNTYLQGAARSCRACRKEVSDLHNERKKQQRRRARGAAQGVRRHDA